MRSSGDRSEHEHLADSIEAKKELRQERIERGTAFLYGPIRHGVSRALRRGDAGQSQLAQVARERGLGDVPSPLEKELSEILLTADGSGVDDLEDRIVPFALVGHCW